jgi:heterodisulfide reductase subunit A-like polyferredoxin
MNKGGGIMNGKPRFVMCNCTGECPGFKDMNFWQLLNFVRNELDAEYAVLHPQLCVDDGERFLLEILKPDTLYIIGACDPRMQKKMFRDAFEKSGTDFDRQVIPLDLRSMSTEAAIGKVKDAFGQAQQQLKTGE